MTTIKPTLQETNAVEPQSKALTGREIASMLKWSKVHLQQTPDGPRMVRTADASKLYESEIKRLALARVAFVQEDNKLMAKWTMLPNGYIVKGSELIEADAFVAATGGKIAQVKTVTGSSSKWKIYLFYPSCEADALEFQK